MRVIRYEERAVEGLNVALYEVEVNNARLSTPVKALTKSELIAKQFSRSNVYLPDQVFVCSSTYRKEDELYLNEALEKIRMLLSSSNKAFIYIPFPKGHGLDGVKSSVEYQHDSSTSLLAVPVVDLPEDMAISAVKKVVTEYKDYAVFPVVGLSTKELRKAKGLLERIQDIEGIIIKFRKGIDSFNEVHKEVAGLSSLVKKYKKLPIVIDLPEAFQVTLRGRKIVLESITLLRYFFGGVFSYRSRFILSRNVEKGKTYYATVQNKFEKAFIVDPITYRPVPLAELQNDYRKLEQIKEWARSFALPDGETAAFILDHIEEAFNDPDPEKKLVISSLVSSLNSIIVYLELEEFRRDVAYFKNDTLRSVVKYFSGLGAFE